MATRNASLVGRLIAAFAATAPAAHAAVPRTGPWDSRVPIQPTAGKVATLTFEVSGPPSRRMIRRLDVPGWCKGDPEPTGVWASDPYARVRADGRFTASGGEFSLRGRFVAPDRARVTVRTDVGECTGVRRYVVRRIRRRLPVRSGRYVTIVAGGTASFELEVDAFGREVMPVFFSGAIAATCSDGSQRPLSLLEVQPLINAPIGPAGRFEAVSSPHPTVEISGTFDHGSVAALLDVSDVQPDGAACRARGIPVIGALAFPF